MLQEQNYHSIQQKAESRKVNEYQDDDDEDEEEDDDEGFDDIEFKSSPSVKKEYAA